MDIFGARQWPWHRLRIPRTYIRGLYASARKRASRERAGTRILQDGDRVAWRSNLGGVDTRGRIDILFHSAAGRLSIPAFVLFLPALEQKSYKSAGEGEFRSAMRSPQGNSCLMDGRNCSAREPLDVPALCSRAFCVGPKSAHRRPVEDHVV